MAEPLAARDDDIELEPLSLDEADDDDEREGALADDEWEVGEAGVVGDEASTVGVAVEESDGDPASSVFSVVPLVVDEEEAQDESPVIV